ncbi:hypothetical protein HK101_005932, partial [Irineochytrium annulatum]
MVDGAPRTGAGHQDAAKHQHQQAVAKAYIDGSHLGLVRVYISWTPKDAPEPIRSQITTVIPGDISVELRELVGLVSYVSHLRTVTAGDNDVRMALACSTLTFSSLLDARFIEAGLPLILHASDALESLPTVTWLGKAECQELAVDCAAKTNELLMDGERLRIMWGEVLRLKRVREEESLLGKAGATRKEGDKDKALWIDTKQNDGHAAVAAAYIRMKIRCYVAGIRRNSTGTVTIAALIETHNGPVPEGSIWLAMDLVGPNPSTMIHLMAELMCLEYLFEHLLLDKRWWPDISLHVLMTASIPSSVEKEEEHPLLSARVNELVGILRVRVEPMVATSSQQIKDFVAETRNMVADGHKPLNPVFVRYKESQALFVRVREAPIVSSKRKVESTVDESRLIKKHKAGDVDRLVNCYTDGSGKFYGGVGVVIAIKEKEKDDVSYILGSAPLPVLRCHRITSLLAEWAGLLLCLDLLERNGLSDYNSENRHRIRICCDLLPMTRAMQMESFYGYRQRLHAYARLRCKRLGVNEIRWIARENNQAADHLAKMASWSNTGRTTTSSITMGPSLSKEIVDILTYTSQRWQLERGQ